VNKTVEIIEKNGKKFIGENEIIRAWKNDKGFQWFATEISKIRSIKSETGRSIINGNPENDIIYYGLIIKKTLEWGYFSGKELEIVEKAKIIF